MSTERPAAPRVRAFLAASLDGFLAGDRDDLSWLPQPTDDASGHGDGGFGAFLAGTGVMLMGRRTYDVVSGFEGPWPYGDLPVLVATHRPLQAVVPTVRPVAGTVAELLAAARAAAGDRDVYVDGGVLVRAALDAGLLDELTVTIVPVILGGGIPLGAGAVHRHVLVLERHEVLAGGMMQLTYRPASSPRA